MPRDIAFFSLLDRAFINLDEDYEVQEWTHTLGVTADELRGAVTAVGNTASQVEQYLASHRLP